MVTYMGQLKSLTLNAMKEKMLRIIDLMMLKMAKFNLVLRKIFISRRSRRMIFKSQKPKV
jgi:hypothetical protein